MATIRNSGLTKIRYKDNGELELNNTIKIENKSGDVIIMKPNEIKDVINDYIREELEMYTDDVTKRKKIEIETRIDFKIKTIENGLVDHINDKVNRITEQLLSLTTNRVIEAEVERRLAERIKEIKEKL